MKLLLVSGYAGREGGAHVYTTQLAEGLAARGHTVTLVCHDAQTDLSPLVHIVRVTRPRTDQVPLLWRFGLALETLYWRRVFCRHVSLEQFDVAVCSIAPAIPGLHAARSALSTIYLPHSRIYGDEIRASLENAPRSLRVIATALGSRLEHYSLKKSRTTVTFAHANATALRNRYSLPATVPIEVIPSAIDSPRPIVREAGCKELQLLFVGRLVESKNLALIIDALSTFPREPGWHLKVVGDGPESERSRDMAAALGIADRIDFVGHRDDVSPYYATSDLLLFPSRRESFGLVMVEAMAHGVPVLAFRPNEKFQVANDEIVEDGESGWLVDDAAGFAERLRSLIITPKNARNLSESAKAAYARRFSTEAFFDAWERTLRRVVMPDTMIDEPAA